MEIIVTHTNADFDALSSQVAAQKLYPEARLVLGRVSRPVRDFLALHKDRFPAISVKEIDFDTVRRLILVDVRRPDRLKDFAPLLKRVREGAPVEVIIYDHHPASANDVVGAIEVIEPVGSATTLLLEEIRRRGDIAIDPIEATLMSLGIHTDTGSLTSASTSPRDAEALAWLLGHGASLRMVNRYLSVAFSLDQRELLSSMLESVEVYALGGVEVGFVTIPLDRMVDNMAGVTTQALELAGYEALFALFPVRKGNRVLVIARARVPYVDVAAIIKAVGGGGHPGAASATVKKGDAAQLREQLLEALRIQPPRPRVVGDIMSSPVHTVGPEMPLEKLRDTLQHWRYTGVPVVKACELVGIVSRRDVERAARDERLHLPVGSCMSHNVHTIGPLEPLDVALERMVEADVGRLPVMDDDHLIGIVSRSDLLRVLYRGQPASQGDSSPSGGDQV